MILRSQLRMNKNILFPFVSCILIMLTLLVLIHKSADELNSVKKELVLCKQKYELASTQLQNAIDYKLRLERSLESEKSKDKQHVDELSKLTVEQDDRRKEIDDLKKEKDDANTRIDDLKIEIERLKAKNQEEKDKNDKLNTQYLEQQAEKDREIESLKNKIKDLENIQVPNAKVADNKPVAVVERMDLVNGVSKGPTTAGINPMAIEHEESKQVAPPPNNGHNDNAQDMMRKSLDMRSGDENVLKAPLVKSNEKKEDQFGGEEKKDEETIFKDQQRNLPLPYVKNMAKPKPSSASNNAAEHPAEDQGDNLALPVLHPPADDKEKLGAEIPKHINYQGDEEGEDFMDKNDGPDKNGKDYA